VKDVSRIFGVARGSVYRWLKMANEGHGLAAKPHPGPATQLSLDQQRQLDTLLRQGAEAHGWPNRLWSTQRIARANASRALQIH
jgi:transposase